MNVLFLFCTIFINTCACWNTVNNFNSFAALQRNILKKSLSTVGIAICLTNISPVFAININTSPLQEETSIISKKSDDENNIDESSRVKRKLELQIKSNGLRDDFDRKQEGYLGSLQKEQAKQDGITKKSKSQRAKDLCETLGRGC
jgi:hypothetical protein